MKKELAPNTSIKSIDEVLSEGNKSFDKYQNPAFMEEAYRNAYLFGWLKASYQHLYNVYTKQNK